MKNSIKKMASMMLVLMMVCSLICLPVQAAGETVTITFQANGGAAADGSVVASQQVVSGSSTKLNANPFTREGYTFTGWSTSAGSATGVYGDGQAVGVSKDITLYAIWQINSYELTIRGIDGLAGGDVEYGTDLTQMLPSDPTRDGYRFTGWLATNAAGEEVETPTTMPAYNLTLTAQWEERGSTYLMTFLDEYGDVIVTYAYHPGDAVQIPDYPVPEGMRIAGWRNADNGRIQAVPAVMPAYDMEFLVVIEEIYYTITFMDGTAEVGEVTVNYGEKAMIIDRPAQTGKIFAGWSAHESAQTAEYTPWEEIDLNADMTLYAVWKDAEVTITFVDGQTDVGEITVACGEAVTLIAAPEKSGYTFLGWSTDPNGTEAEYAAGDVITPQGDMNLYALWIEAKPTITLKYPTLSFEDVIVMNVYFAAENLQSVEEIGLITYSEEVSDYGVDTAETVVPGYAWSETDGFYYVTTKGIPAKRLGDTIYFAVYCKLADGSYTYTSLADYSPRTYAYNVLKTGKEEMRPLVVAMLNYGAAAQNYFSYRTDALVSSDLTADQLAMIDGYSSTMMSKVTQPDAAKLGQMVSNGGYRVYYPTISFEGAFCINYYVAPSAAPAGEITMYVWNQKDYNAASSLSRENATQAITMECTDSGEYLAMVEGIAAKDLDRGIYVCFCYSDGTTDYCSGVIGYSIGTYCVAQAAKTGTLADLAAATAVYGYYARELFYEK